MTNTKKTGSRSRDLIKSAKCMACGSTTIILKTDPLYDAAEGLLEVAKEWAFWIDTLPGGIEQFEKWARKQNNWADMPLVSRTRDAIKKAGGTA